MVSPRLGRPPQDEEAEEEGPAGGCGHQLQQVPVAPPLTWEGASLLTKLVKNLPAMQVTLVSFLGWEDPVEKG